MEMEDLLPHLLSKIVHIREIAELAYRHAQREGMSHGDRRAWERLGIRAVDLIETITLLVNKQL